MPRFVPVNVVEDLPSPTSHEAREQYVLDFKETVDPTKWWELAKDMAAFANALGGVILVGAKEGPPPTYEGVPPSLADHLQKAYEDAAKDHLSPMPIVDPVVIAVPEGRALVAVNVHPYADQPVGARLPKPNKKGELVPYESWQFPLRVGRHTKYLVPAMLPMLTNAVVRRTVILLESIPKPNAPEYRHPRLVWRNPRNQSDEAPGRTEVRIESVDPEKNVVVLAPTAASQSRFRVPLDDVEAVWEASDNEWHIRVSGSLKDGREYVSNPSNAIFRT